MKIISNLIEAHIFRKMNDNIEFLLLKRSPVQYYPNIWQMVSGKIKSKEKAYDCALREIKEETGLSPLSMWVVPNVNSLYNADKNSITLVPVFAVKVNYDCNVILSNEHVEYEWMSPEQAKKQLAWVGQHRSVDIIVDYFFNNNLFWNFLEIRI